MNEVRIQKIISDAGLASRREAERFIREGMVTINGRLAKVGDKADPDKDHVKVRGKLIVHKPKKVVIAFFKPRGIHVAPLKRIREEDAVDTSIWNFLENFRDKVQPIGKLDTDAEGLLLLTNDGELLNRLNRSRFEVPRTYRVKIDGRLEEKKIKRLQKGIQVEDTRVKFHSIEPGRENAGKTWYRVELTHPRSRIIRKAFEGVGHPVDKVSRDSFAGVSAKGLDRGDWRYLTEIEIKALRSYVGLK